MAAVRWHCMTSSRVRPRSSLQNTRDGADIAGFLRLDQDDTEAGHGEGVYRVKRKPHFGNSQAMKRLFAVVAIALIPLSASAQFRIPKRLPHIPIEKIPGVDKL